VDERGETFSRLLAVWNGEVDLDALESLVTPAYRGHLGSRDRDLAGLKRDIAAYRDRVPGVHFRVEHQFGEGNHLASRLTAHAPSVRAGEPATVCGLNISRWEGGLLAEEWAVWEAFGQT
jgi:SnoaL-like polyketide cyclase